MGVFASLTVSTQAIFKSFAFETFKCFVFLRRFSFSLMEFSLLGNVFRLLFFTRSEIILKLFKMTYQMVTYHTKVPYKVPYKNTIQKYHTKYHTKVPYRSTKLKYHSYLAFGPHSGSGFSGNLVNLSCLDVGLAPGLYSKHTSTFGARLRICAPGDLSCFFLTGFFTTHTRRMSQTTKRLGNVSRAG